ncbi:MAG: glycosyltransferase family 39 protein [Elainellaceae cyanobacterium]
MQTNPSLPKSDWQLPSVWFFVLVVLILLLGIVFRLINLGDKVYWFDEVFTSLRIFGHTFSDAYQAIYSPSGVEAQALQTFQTYDPNKPLSATIQGLAQSEPQLTPLYFILARFWAIEFGDSVATIRSLSAVVNLFIFPAFYWLCNELFKSPVMAWMGVALMAVSPFHVLYAQEARPYSLWAVSIVLMSAALLWAIRIKTRVGWAIYAIALALSLYSFLLSVLVAIGHGIYVIGTERFRITPNLISYFLASFAGCLLFVPWVFVILTNAQATDSVTGWTQESIGFLPLVKIWILNLNRVFLDVDFGLSNPLTYLIVPITVLSLYSMYYVCRYAPLRVWLFILTLIAVTALVLTLPDLVFGGRRSTATRYFVPCFIGIQLAMTYLLSQKAFVHSIPVKWQRGWQVVVCLVLCVGVVSCLISSQEQAWWNKYNNQENIPIAQVINQASNPLIISDKSPANFISLSYSLKADVRLKGMNPADEMNMATRLNGVDSIFLVNPSRDLKRKFQQNYELEQVYKGRYQQLWKLLD